MGKHAANILSGSTLQLSGCAAYKEPCQRKIALYRCNAEAPGHAGEPQLVIESNLLIEIHY